MFKLLACLIKNLDKECCPLLMIPIYRAKFFQIILCKIQNSLKSKNQFHNWKPLPQKNVFGGISHEFFHNFHRGFSTHLSIGVCCFGWSSNRSVRMSNHSNGWNCKSRASTHAYYTYLLECFFPFSCIFMLDFELKNNQ